MSLNIWFDADNGPHVLIMRPLEAELTRLDALTDKPMSGTRVSWLGAEHADHSARFSPSGSTRVTDPAGRLTLNLPEGKYRFYLGSAPRWEDAHVVVQWDGGTGELAVRVNRRNGRHTVAYLHPPALFGELSFITGRPCSADIDVTVDATVASLPREILEQHSNLMQAILQGATTLLAAPATK